MGNVTAAKLALSTATYAIDKPYDYLLPPELAGQARPGMRALVPFGAGNRRSEGLILSVGPAPERRGLKSVLALLDEEPVLGGELLSLALWMRERYFCTVYDAARAMLPAGLSFSIRDSYRLSPGVTEEQARRSAGRSDRARQVVELLLANGGGAELGRIRAAFGVADPMPALRRLAEQGIVTVETACTRGVGDKTGRVASLTLPPERALEQVTPRRKSAPLRYAVVQLLSAVGSATVKEIGYYTGATLSTLRSLEKSGLVCLREEESFRRVDIGPVPSAPPPVLTGEQERAFQGLLALARREEAGAALLYGVTGSGKTQVYLRLVREMLEQGRSALVLVPEIALTPQLLRIFTAHFGEEVAVLHSSLRAGERYDEWKRVRSGRAHVVLGTRSAVFAPVEKLGVIILDEEQESSYKSESAPRYHAAEVAKFRCVRHSALLLLGSATPSVESFYRARQGSYHLFSLKNRYNAQALPAVHIADRREDLRRGVGGSLGSLLREELAKNLSAGEQSILFLNRRGANRMLTCGMCGHSFECPRCSVKLTYHSANQRLMCHHCGHSQPKPERCPLCGGTLEQVGVGTQQVERELEELFPGVEVLRMDADTVGAARGHDKLLSYFRDKRIPILLGTQMVAKGLDFETVTLVGVLDADLALYVDDYRAGERAFSQLTQVVGRAGRGSRAGRAVIQTWSPDNEIITLAARQDYDAFYRQEIDLRRLRGLPPFLHLFVFTAVGTEEAAVLRACQRLRGELERLLEGEAYRALSAQVLGPAPAAVAKVNRRYRYRVTLAAPDRREIRRLVAHLVRAAQLDRNNRGVTVFADRDPLE